MQSPTRGRALGLHPLSRVCLFFFLETCVVSWTDVGDGIGFPTAFGAIDCAAYRT